MLTLDGIPTAAKMPPHIAKILAYTYHGGKAVASVGIAGITAYAALLSLRKTFPSTFDPKYKPPRDRRK
jgi:hypothetical protein